MPLKHAELWRALNDSFDANPLVAGMPELDDLTRWAGVRVRHAGFELTRQQKISERLAPYLADGGRAHLAVCYRWGRHQSSGSLNCGECEKCLRTAAGLLVAGIDPGETGLTISRDAYDRWTERLRQGLPLAPHNLPFWQESRAGLSVRSPLPTDPAAARFLTALESPGSLVAARKRVDRAEYLRTYWARRRTDRWRQVRVAAGTARNRAGLVGVAQTS